MSTHLEGLRKSSKIGWRNWMDAQKMDLTPWTSDALADRYKVLCDSIPEIPVDHPHRPGDPRWGDPYHEWLEAHGAEVVAISHEITRRWRRGAMP